MISVAIVEMILVAQLTVSIIIYLELKDKPTDNEKNAENLSLVSLILSASFILFLAALYFVNYLSKRRTEFLMIYGTMIIAIVLAIAYYYMHKAQSDKREFALYTAIASAVMASNMAFFLVGSYSFSKQEIKYLEKHHYHPAQIIEKQVPAMELEEEVKPDCLEKAKLFII